MSMIITKTDYPRVYERIFENQENYAKLSERMEEFNKKMIREKNIRFAALLMSDRLILDDNVCDEFSDLCEELGIERKVA